MSKRILFDNIGSVLKIEDSDSSKIPLEVLDTGININSDIIIDNNITVNNGDITINNGGSVFVDSETNINIGGDDLNTYVTNIVTSSGVPSSRIISTGTGLTGGGDLSSDRALSVDSTVLLTTQDNTMGDNNSISFGASDDMSLYHDGTNSYIDSSTGDLFIRADNSSGVLTNAIRIRSGFSETPFVQILEQGVVRLSVQTGGVSITGDLQVTGNLFGSGDLSITSELNMASNRITSLASPAASGDAVNRSYLETEIAEEAISRESVSEPSLKYKVLEIGDWDMDSSGSIDVNHGMGSVYSDIRSVDVLVRNDADTQIYPLVKGVGGPSDGGYIGNIDSTRVRLGRAFSGFFDSTDFDSTSYNRGWVTVLYEV